MVHPSIIFKIFQILCGFSFPKAPSCYRGVRLPIYPVETYAFQLRYGLIITKWSI